MQPLLAVSRVIDAVTGFIGHHIRWLILAAVLVSATLTLLLFGATVLVERLAMPWSRLHSGRRP